MNYSCRRYLVSGVVQGVGFRYHAQRQALLNVLKSIREDEPRLGLVGWVKNRIDGDVELVACGAQARLDQLESWLWQGPSMARVKKVEVEILHDSEHFTAFSIH